MDKLADRLSATPSPRSLPPRQGNPTAPDKEAGTRFAEKLAAKDRALTEGKEAGLLQGALTRLTGDHERFGGGKHGFGEDQAEDPSVALAAAGGQQQRDAAPAATPASTTAAPRDPAIDRMAAAIAELSSKAGEQSLRVDFAAGALAEGALVTRDAQSGALSIRVVGLISGLNDRRREQIESDLRLGLEKRHIRAALHFETRPPVLPAQGRLG